MRYTGRQREAPRVREIRREGRKEILRGIHGEREREGGTVSERECVCDTDREMQRARERDRYSGRERQQDAYTYRQTATNIDRTRERHNNRERQRDTGWQDSHTDVGAATGVDICCCIDIHREGENDIEADGAV